MGTLLTEFSVLPGNLDPFDIIWSITAFDNFRNTVPLTSLSRYKHDQSPDPPILIVVPATDYRHPSQRAKEARAMEYQNKILIFLFNFSLGACLPGFLGPREMEPPNDVFFDQHARSRLDQTSLVTWQR